MYLFVMVRSFSIIDLPPQEHRRVKSSFRELMDATLDSSVSTSPDVEMVEVESQEFRRSHFISSRSGVDNGTEIRSNNNVEISSQDDEIQVEIPTTSRSKLSLNSSSFVFLTDTTPVIAYSDFKSPP